MPPDSRIAVVDLGTNSTRLLVADVAGDGSLTELERRSEVTRLGDGVDATGRLSGEAVDRVLTCLAGYREIADEANAGRRIAVATSSVLAERVTAAGSSASIDPDSGASPITLSMAILSGSGASSPRGVDSKLIASNPAMWNRYGRASPSTRR